MWAQWPNYVKLCLHVIDCACDRFRVIVDRGFFTVYPNKWYQSEVEIAQSRCYRNRQNQRGDLALVKS